MRLHNAIIFVEFLGRHKSLRPKAGSFRSPCGSACGTKARAAKF